MTEYSTIKLKKNKKRQLLLNFGLSYPWNKKLSSLDFWQFNTKRQYKKHRHHHPIRTKINRQVFLNLNAQIELELGMPVDMMKIDNAPQSLKENILASSILIKGTRRLQQKLQRASV